jgi:hypothetical protein
MVQDGVQWFGQASSWTIAVGSSNDAEVRPAESSVPGSVPAGGTATVRVRVFNRGSTTWRAASAHRLGAAPDNQVAWSSFGCGGYMNGPTDGRAFPCQDVPPGGSHDFTFQVRMGASGPQRLAVRMVQDGVQWFGAAYTWTITTGSTGLPDVVVDSVNVSPANPSSGQQTTFSSIVRNAGSASTPAGVPIGVAYFIDGTYTTWGAIAGPLAPGASATVTTQGGAWTATAGTHTLAAVADDVNRFAESNESNNSLSKPFTVASLPPASGDLYGMNIDPANPAGNPTAQQLRDLGVRWVRIEWKIDRGHALYDGVIASYRAAGLKVMLLLDYTTLPPKPHYNSPDAEWRSYLGSFVARVSDLARYYRDGVDAWQIWNEPDLFAPVPGYDPGVPAHIFGEMLRDATAAIRPHSSRPVVTGGLASGDPGYLARARDAVGGLTVDFIGVHPYGQRAPDNWPNPFWGFGNMSDLFDRYLAFGRPLWVSEINTDNLSLQPDYLQNVYALARGEYAGRVPVVFWFCWSDGMVPPFGVVNSAGQAKPAYHRYRSIAPQ